MSELIMQMQVRASSPKSIFDVYAFFLFDMSQEWELNPRPTVYETVALPLSYPGAQVNRYSLIVTWK